MLERFNGKEKVHAANGTCMPITHAGQSHIRTPFKTLKLKNVLHVPQVDKHLLSVHCLARDNDIFFKFHPHHFFVKDRASRILLLHGRCENGLYPISLESVILSKTVLLAAAKPTVEQWHERLGHPSIAILHQVLECNKLSFSQNKTMSSVCDAL